jgi:cysteine desulfurase
MDRIYLDNNATTRMEPEVRDAFLEAVANFGNPSSVHAEGRHARRALEEARGEVARLIGARFDEVYFTSGGTESDTLAILGAPRPTRAVRTAAEHPAVRQPFERLKSLGVETVSVKPRPDGVLETEAFLAEVPPAGALVAVMAASNEYGGLFPVAEIAAGAKARGAFIHTDAVQAAGKVPVDVGAWGVDTAAFSAHKLHGPKGIGALYVRRGVRIEPLAPGGGQERRVRGGTENVPGILAFGVAARLARERLEEDATSMRRLRDRLEQGILASVPGARVVGALAPRLPNTSTILFEDAAGEALLIRLDLSGVAVSAGSACSSGSPEPPEALLALAIPAEEARCALRFSLSRATRESEIDAVLERLPRMVADTRAGVPALSETPS